MIKDVEKGLFEVVIVHVKEVVVYKEHIEVIFNVSFSLLKNDDVVEVISNIRRYELYERYSQSFYINVG